MIRTGYKNGVNISLLDAQIKTINSSSLCFNFHPQPYVSDISEGGQMRMLVYFNNISNNSILGVSNEVTGYIIKIMELWRFISKLKAIDYYVN